MALSTEEAATLSAMSQKSTGPEWELLDLLVQYVLHSDHEERVYRCDDMRTPLHEMLRQSEAASKEPYFVKEDY